MQDKIYIVGAHSRGQTFKEYVTFLYPATTVVAYLVDDLRENADKIEDIPVKIISKSSELHTDYPVYIATKGIYHEKIIGELQELGMKRIFPVDVDMDRKLRNEYVKSVYKKNNKNFCCIDENAARKSIHARIYVATSIFDKELQSDYVLLADERVIQVGAALTEKRLDKNIMIDCTGENISVKNKQYCELTALYWIWKNAQQDIVGLVHYRRHFLLPDDWIEWMNYNEIDVILPVPLYVSPSIEGNYKERHSAMDWECMMNYFAKNNPDDYKAADRFFKGNLYSPCNMFIMRKDVLDEMCKWLFPIIDAVVEQSGQRCNVYQNRYPGFLSERLITYFFECKCNKYKIAYANKNFLN